VKKQQETETHTHACVHLLFAARNPSVVPLPLFVHGLLSLDATDALEVVDVGLGDGGVSARTSVASEEGFNSDIGDMIVNEERGDEDTDDEEIGVEVVLLSSDLKGVRVGVTHASSTSSLLGFVDEVIGGLSSKVTRTQRVVYTQYHPENANTNKIVINAGRQAVGKNYAKILPYHFSIQSA
jgi:hypothetical protein